MEISAMLRPENQNCGKGIDVILLPEGPKFKIKRGPYKKTIKKLKLKK